MIILKTYLPKDVVAMAIWPFILIRKRGEIKDWILRHEQIHHCQQKEMLIIAFYMWYLLEYCIRVAIYRNKDKAYRNICFEKESYSNQFDDNYLKKRRLFNFIKYL